MQHFGVGALTAFAKMRSPRSNRNSYEGGDAQQAGCGEGQHVSGIKYDMLTAAGRRLPSSSSLPSYHADENSADGRDDEPDDVVDTDDSVDIFGTYSYFITSITYRHMLGRHPW